MVLQESSKVVYFDVILSQMILSHWMTSSSMQSLESGTSRTKIFWFKLLSVAQLCPTLCDPRAAALQTSLSFTISWSLLKLMFIESVMPSNHLIVCYPLLLPLIFPSIRVFSNESALRIRWPKYWSLSFSFNISSSNEYSGLISFKIDWLDLPAVQGTQDSSPPPQFKSISSLALSLLCGLTLTSTHDYWKNRSFD